MVEGAGLTDAGVRLPIKVLIVDDEPDVLLLLRITLEAAGLQTGLAADGDEALQRMRRERFDAVLLDLNMPVLDGYGVLEALRADPSAPPVVVLSAWTGAAARQRALGLGAVAYLTKPPDFEALAGQITAVVAAREGGRPPGDS